MNLDMNKMSFVCCFLILRLGIVVFFDLHLSHPSMLCELHVEIQGVPRMIHPLPTHEDNTPFSVSDSIPARTMEERQRLAELRREKQAFPPLWWWNPEKGRMEATFF